MFYIKPQPISGCSQGWPYWFTPMFYIKPQRCAGRCHRHKIDSHLCSTSNHNCLTLGVKVYKIDSHLCSTSNHNSAQFGMFGVPLIHTYVLHQTTTRGGWVRGCPALIHTYVLHQTTTLTMACSWRTDWFTPMFYIKPQPVPNMRHMRPIDSHLCSTSNHNHFPKNRTFPTIDSHLCSTSNHNSGPCRKRRRSIDSHLCSTSNHNVRYYDKDVFELIHTYVLHQTTTPWPRCSMPCVLIHTYVLHQTTTYSSYFTYL